ncbi:MAG: DNA/RNA nuclease SfsA [Methanomicrobiales archaeon]|nr:DNA/RNA nuclease SfsA [Methanomicrobiales archaeon]
MQFPGQLEKGIFLSRPNRFLGMVRVRGGEAGCYVPNSGRLREILKPGTPVYLRDNASERRKTRWDLILARHGEILVSVDTRMVNLLIPEAIRSGSVPSLRGLEVLKSEYQFLDSRLDFLARDGECLVLLEGKSCTLVEGGVALFPDAPTERGRRHLKTLSGGARRGLKAMVVFVIQREDGELFSPNAGLDPEFGRAFQEALVDGVKACAFTCKVGKTGITPYREIPVLAQDLQPRLLSHEKYSPQKGGRGEGGTGGL